MTRFRIRAAADIYSWSISAALLWKERVVCNHPLSLVAFVPREEHCVFSSSLGDVMPLFDNLQYGDFRKIAVALTCYKQASQPDATFERYSSWSQASRVPRAFL